MLNQAAEMSTIAEALRQDGRLQIENFLPPGVADRLHRSLAEDVPWALSLHGENGLNPLTHEQYGALSEVEKERLCRTTAEGARRAGFNFVFENYEMIQAYKAQRDPGLLLHKLLEELNSPNFLDWTRQLTGDMELRRVSAQATRYRPGHFLRLHDDTDRKEGRRFAYVLNLSRNWQADWGGLLHFFDRDAQKIHTFLPRWNSLSVFRVPYLHWVSLVAPWAEEDRYAITGWFLI